MDKPEPARNGHSKRPAIKGPLEKGPLEKGLYNVGLISFAVHPM
jgi:hypothetical protein